MKKFVKVLIGVGTGVAAFAVASLFGKKGGNTENGDTDDIEVDSTDVTESEESTDEVED